MIMSKTSLTLEYLHWDSQFFKKNVYSINVANDTSFYEIKKLIKAARAKDIDVVYVICSTFPHSVFIKTAIKNAIITEKVTFSKHITHDNMLPLNSVVIPYEGEETQELIELALLSGKHSRFFVDERFRPDFERLYYTWLKNSLNKSIADRVFIAPSGERIRGFVTCRANNQSGTIGLIAVNSNFQGQGFGKSLMAATEDYYLGKNISDATVVTQEQNTTARQFYSKCGYTKVKTETIFHWWSNNK